MTFTGCPAHLRRRTLFEKNGACLPVLFHVLEPRVHNLFDAEEFGAEDVAGIVDLTAQVRAQIIDPPIGPKKPSAGRFLTRPASSFSIMSAAICIFTKVSYGISSLSAPITQSRYRQ